MINKKYQNPEGGLNEAGRKYFEKTGQSKNLKPPVSKKQAEKSPKSASRRKSFCARMSGIKKKLTSKEKARDSNSRINKALRKWEC